MPNRVITLHKPTAGASVGVGFATVNGVTTVNSIADGSLSAAAGLETGMKVLSINGKTVTSAPQGTSLIKESSGAVQIIISAAVPPSAAQVAPVSSSGVTDQHLVIFNKQQDACARIEPPPYDSWFRSQGVSEADFDEMMKKIVEPVNTYVDHLPCYIVVTIISCGLAGWCCQIAEAAAMKSTIQVILDEFTAKYPSVRGRISEAPPGLSFTGAEVAAPPVVVAVAADPAVMQRDPQQDNPEEKLTQLKSMHDKGLITDDEHAAKRAEILAKM